VISLELKRIDFNANRLTGLTTGTVGLVNELARPSMSGGQPSIRVIGGNGLQGHPQRHTSGAPFQIGAGFRLVDNNDVVRIGG